MQKGAAGLFLLIAGLVTIGIFGVFYLGSSKHSVSPLILKPSPIAPKDLTYSNKKLNFQFQYPAKDWTIKEDTEEEFNQRGNGNFRKNFKGYVGYEPPEVLGAIVALDKENSFDKSPFAAWIFDNPDNLTIDKWFQNYWYYPFLWGVFDYTSKGHVAPDKEATISGKEAKYKIVSYQPDSPKFMYVSNQGKMYLFRIIGEEGDKILDTFRFTQ